MWPNMSWGCRDPISDRLPHKKGGLGGRHRSICVWQWSARGANPDLLNGLRKRRDRARSPRFRSVGTGEWSLAHMHRELHLGVNAAEDIEIAGLGKFDIHAVARRLFLRIEIEVRRRDIDVVQELVVV